MNVSGPNVSIGKNARIGGGTRIRESIIRGDSVIGEHSLILYSVIGEYQGEYHTWQLGYRGALTHPLQCHR